MSQPISPEMPQLLLLSLQSIVTQQFAVRLTISWVFNFLVNIVLKQGVCTLVTTFQTYKILAMSCLISAYSMSALHMQKTKFSEM